MLIAEPVQNGGGAFVPPPGYWAGLRALCDRYSIVLVADETITAFGRVGEWFASSLFDGRPDIITFAKGVTAGHAPLGGFLMTEAMAAPFVTGGQTSPSPAAGRCGPRALQRPARWRVVSGGSSPATGALI